MRKYADCWHYILFWMKDSLEMTLSCRVSCLRTYNNCLTLGLQHHPIPSWQLLDSNLQNLPAGVSRSAITDWAACQKVLHHCIWQRNTVCISTLSCRLLCLNPYSLSLAPLVYFCGLSVQLADTEFNQGGIYQHSVSPKLT